MAAEPLQTVLCEGSVCWPLGVPELEEGDEGEGAQEVERLRRSRRLRQPPRSDLVGVVVLLVGIL